MKDGRNLNGCYWRFVYCWGMQPDVSLPHQEPFFKSMNSHLRFRCPHGPRYVGYSVFSSIIYAQGISMGAKETHYFTHYYIIHRVFATFKIGKKCHWYSHHMHNAERFESYRYFFYSALLYALPVWYRCYSSVTVTEVRIYHVWNQIFKLVILFLVWRY